MVALPLVHVSWAIEPERRKACDRFFVDVFGADPIYEVITEPDAEDQGFDRDESLLLVSDCMLIPVAPAGKGLELRSPVGEMLRRATKSNTWLGVALRVADLRQADLWLRERGIIPHFDPGQESQYCMVRRKETLGLRVELIRADIPNDPRKELTWRPTWWRDHHPLGIEGLLSIGVSVPDLADAERVFARTWEWPKVGEGVMPCEDADFAAFDMGDCFIEAMQSRHQASRLADHTRESGGIYCLTFKVRSLEAARDYLSAKGLRIGEVNGGRFSIDPAQAFDRLIYFTEESPPGYPRFDLAQARLRPAFGS